jgi:hypothetical protein
MDMTNLNEVKVLHSSIRTIFDMPQGKDLLAFLEEACGWYESIFDPADKDRILVNAGRREVVATLHTFLRFTPEQIVAMALQKEHQNG